MDADSVRSIGTWSGAAVVVGSVAGLALVVPGRPSRRGSRRALVAVAVAPAVGAAAFTVFASLRFVHIWNLLLASAATWQLAPLVWSGLLLSLPRGGRARAALWTAPLLVASNALSAVLFFVASKCID